MEGETGCQRSPDSSYTKLLKSHLMLTVTGQVREIAGTSVWFLCKEESDNSQEN